jgi:sphingolipid delta-4 desaturase
MLSWSFFLTAYVIGATANQNLFLAIHEISHNLAFRSPLANRVFAVFANLPIGIPYSASFRPYHLTHHKSLGVNGLDTDLPTAFEALFLDSVAGKAFFCTFQILFYALRPMFVYKLPLTKIHAFNIAAQLAFDYALVQFVGGRALAYLILSSFLAGSLHPCAGHFIAEHYVFEKTTKDAKNPANKIPLPETYSYYGPLNFFTYNVGLHNEHHDFPAIPWTRLPKLRRIAHDFYDDLPIHKSWVNVMWQFVWDKDISLWCRVKREQGGRKVGAGSGWTEEDLGANDRKPAEWKGPVRMWDGPVPPAPGPDRNDHMQYMRLALDQAQESQPKPTNYRVGALLVDSNTGAILSRGYTLECEGNTHAEQCCLMKYAQAHHLPEDLAGHALPPSTVLYTTMEPCNLRLSGNLPCVDRIIRTTNKEGEKMIKKVYVGVKEPETFVGENVGRKKLEDHGIECVLVPGLEEMILTIATAGHAK